MFVDQRLDAVQGLETPRRNPPGTPMKDHLE